MYGSSQQHVLKIGDFFINTHILTIRLLKSLHCSLSGEVGIYEG